MNDNEARDAYMRQQFESQSQKGLSVTGQATPQQMAQAQDQVIQKQMDEMTGYEEEVYKLGPQAYERLGEIRDMPALDRAALAAGRETDKLMAGAGDIYDFIQDVTTGGSEKTGIRALDIFNSILDKGTPLERTAKRSADQREKDIIFKEAGENLGGASIAAMLPYMATGYGAGPASTKLAESVVGGIAKGIDKTQRAGRGLLTRGIEKGASTPGPFQPLASKMKSEWTDPMRQRAIRKSKTPKNIVPWREGLVKDVLGGAGLGALEGGLHYDNNIVEGSLAGAGGTTAGRFVRPFVNKRPSSYGEADRQIIDEAQQMGMQFFPGGRTGHRGDQAFEAGLRSSKTWGEPLAVVDRNNAKVMNRTAYEAMGVPAGKVDQMTQKNMLEHVNSLKSEYDTVVKGSVGRFSPESINRIRAGSKSFTNDFSEAGVKAKDVVDARLKDIQSRIHNTRDAITGQYRPATFRGEDYQSMSQSIKSELDGLYKNNDMVAHGALKKVQRELDDAMDNGVNYGGKVSSTEWKDLNERYAMSRLLMENGMDITGKFDAELFGKYLMSKDAYRTLTGQGGRIKPLQKLARANYLSKQEAGSDMTGTGFGDSGKVSHMQGFLTNKVGNMLPLKDQIYLSLYKRGWPGEKGLLGMSDKGFWNPVLLGRAQAQAQQQHPTAAKAIRDTKNSMSKSYGEAADWTGEKMDEMDKFMKSLFEG